MSALGGEADIIRQKADIASQRSTSQYGFDFSGPAGGAASPAECAHGTVRDPLACSTLDASSPSWGLRPGPVVIPSRPARMIGRTTRAPLARAWRGAGARQRVIFATAILSDFPGTRKTAQESVECDLASWGTRGAPESEIALYAACMLLETGSKIENRHPLRLVLPSGPNSARGVEVLPTVLRTEFLDAAAVVPVLELGPAPRARLAAQPV